MRITRGAATRSRRNKVLKRSRGMRGAASRLYSAAKEKNDRALAYGYRDRKVKKREFRSLWTQRINAAARLNGTNYSRLMGALKKANISLNRKVLADMAVKEPRAFSEVVKQVLSP